MVHIYPFHAANHGVEETPRDIHLIHIRGIQENIGEFIRGIKKTRSLWYHVVHQGPGDESDNEEEDDY